MSWDRKTGYGFRYGGEGARGVKGPGLRDRIDAFFAGRQQKDAPQQVVVDRGLPPVTWTDRNAKNYVSQGYKINSAVYAVTKALANAFAEPPLLCYEDETKKKVIAKHPVRKLISRPNEYMGEDEFWKYLITYACTTGNGYGQLVPSLAGNPVQMWPYSDIVMSPVPVGRKFIDHYNYSIDGINFIELPVAEIMHFKWSIDPEMPWKGLGALHPVAREVDSDNELTRYLKALLQNDAMPRTIIKPAAGANLTKSEMKEAKQEFELRYGGDRFGSVGVVSRDVDISRMGLNMQELAFDAIRGVPEARIAAAYGVPAIVAGLNIGLARSTYSNYEEARRAFTEQTLAPLWAAVASEIQQSVVPLLGNDCFVAFDLGQVRALQEGNDKTLQRTIQAGQAGFLTINEVREDLGREPMDGGDQLSKPKAPTPPTPPDNGGESAPEPAVGNANGGSDDEAFANAGNGGVGAGQGLAGGSGSKEFNIKAQGKKQAEIEKQIKARVQSYLAETYDKIASHVEAA